MSKPELDIIHSPEAEAFLRSVTKGFYSRSYIGLWIYEIIGREWDELRQWLEGMCTEIHPQTCTWSIAVWEWLYGLAPGDGMTLPLRRQRLFQKISGARPVNQDFFRRNISNILSIPIASVSIDELAGPYAFSVTISDGPDNALMSCGAVLSFIQNVKPAHIRLKRLRCAFQPIQFTGRPEYFLLKNLRFMIHANNYDCIFLRGDHRLDGTWLLDQSAGRLWLVRAGIRTGVRQPHRLNLSLFRLSGGINVRTEERIPLRLSAAVYPIDNMGGFVRLNGREDLDGSWLLGQLPRAPVLLDFRTGLRAREPEERIRYSAAGIRAIQRLDGGCIGRMYLAAEAYHVGPTRERISGTLTPRTAFLEKEDLYLCRLALAAHWETVNRVVISPPALYPYHFENPQALRVRGLRLNESTRENTGGGRISTGAGAFGIRDTSGNLGRTHLGMRKPERFNGIRLMNGASKFNGGDVTEVLIS